MKNEFPTLPDLPSALIRVALDDLRKAEAAKNVLIEMETFYALYFGRDLEQEYYNKQLDKNQKYCCVCLAGTVMIGSLGADTDDENVDTTLWGTEIRNKLYALNHFRCGSILPGLHDMGINDFRVKDVRDAFGEDELYPQEDDYERVEVKIPPYNGDPTLFKQRLNFIADRLESIGY